MKPEMIKLTFVLSDAIASRLPVSTESIWCEREQVGFRIKNAPFFVDGLSFDDVISVKEGEAGTVALDRVLVKSKNSTLWIQLHDLEAGQCAIEQLVALGCGVESGVLSGYYSINVPERVSMDAVYGIVDPDVDKQILSVAYPSIRHE